MTYVVTESCVKCKYTDCVDVCPVDCFHEGPNFLAIDPDECIDCGVCQPECPVDAIYSSEQQAISLGDEISVHKNYEFFGHQSNCNLFFGKKGNF